MTLATTPETIAAWGQSDLTDVMEFHYAAGMEESLPRNRPNAELRYIRAGEGRWRWAQKVMNIQAGDILFAPARPQSERLEVTGKGALKMDVLCIPEDTLEGLREGCADWQTARTFRRCRLAGEFAAAMRECLCEKALGRPGWRNYVAARSQMLLVNFYRIILLRRQRPVGQVNSRGDVGRARVVEYIRNLESNFFGAETIDQIAEGLGMSNRRFSALFREITGTTWLKYLHELRIHHAKRLLATKDDPVSLIAFQSGFEDTTTFYRVFKSQAGQTPSEWRLQARRPLSQAAAA